MTNRFFLQFSRTLFFVLLFFCEVTRSNERLDASEPPIAVHGRLSAIAEFEPTDAVLLAWNSNYATVYTDIVSALTNTVTVYFLVHNLVDKRSAIKKLHRAGIDKSAIQFIEHRFNTIWIRDYGPISVRRSDGTYAVVDSGYADDRPGDDNVPWTVAQHFKLPIFESGLFIDGGNFMTNGKGLCVMTDFILEDNPDLSAKEISQLLRALLGCEQTITLERLDGEETGHVDVFAKFVSEDTILLGEYDDWQDPLNATILDNNAALLEKTNLANGKKLQIVRIPMGSNGDGVFRSFVNSLYVNETLIMPTYGMDDTLEKEALEIYRSVLPARARILTIDASEIIEGEGAVHCITLGIRHGGH